MWPPRSLDLSSSDFYHWGFLKGGVHRNNQTLKELKQNIDNIKNIIQETYRKEKMHGSLKEFIFNTWYNCNANF
jgi:hypothetical protein